MYIWTKFIAFILSAIAAMNSQIADMKKQEQVKQEPVQEIVQINEPEVKEEPEVVELEPIRYENHLYLNNIDVEVIEIDATSTYQLQQIVDGPGAAAYQYYKALYIGDHNYQAFATLPQVKVGDLMYWKNKTYKCYYADDFGYLDNMGYIRLSNGEQLYDQEAIAVVTCKDDFVRYIRLFKEV